MAKHRPTKERQALFGLIVLLLFSFTVQADGPPPRDLHFVVDHWTAWNPPTHPPGTPVYIIKPGDTLWAIAQRSLGDPHLWPQIWEQNQYILDSHWIYPGDPLLVPGTVLQAPEGEVGVASSPLDQPGASEATDAEAGLTGEDPFASALEGKTSEQGDAEEGSYRDSSLSNVPEPLGSESDIYCTGYIGPLDEQFPYAVSGSEYEFLTPTLDPQRGKELQGLYGKVDAQKFGLGPGDIVYLNGGSADGLSPGELLSAVEVQDKVVHPIKGNILGQYYRHLGRIRVLTVQEKTSIGEIVRNCLPIKVGSKLKLFQPEPVPLRRRTALRPPTFPVPEEELVNAPIIIKSFENVVTLGRGYLVYIDSGEAQDVLPGDVFTIYRRGRRGYPPLVLGELGILSVTENTALANILESRYTIHVGDALVIK
jgi:LysM repeat protein